MLGFSLGLDLTPTRGEEMGYASYDPFTRPFWLDIMDRMRRPFPVRNTFGYADTAVPAVPTAAKTLSAQTNANSGVFTLGTGEGASFDYAKMPVLVGDGASNWQLLVVSSVTGDAVTCLPAARENWPAGSKFNALWANAAHLTGEGYKWLAALLATATVDQFSFVGGFNLLGDIGDMSAYTGEGPEVPDGWELVNAEQVADTTVHSSWAETTDMPMSRIVGTGAAGYGILIKSAATDTGGTGIQLADPIPVLPGEEYVLSALCQGNGSGRFTLQAYDVTNSAVITEFSYPGAYSISYATESTAMRRFSLRVRIPAGTAAGAAPCTSLQVRYLTTDHEAAAYAGYLDDVRLIKARSVRGGNVTALPSTSEYVVPDVRPQPIVLFGDSWGAGSTLFVSTLQARWPGIRIIDMSQSGYKLYQLNAVFDTLVAPLRPAVVIHYSGMANDAVASRTQSQFEGDVDTFIDNARRIGARPVFFGMSPATASTAGDFATSANRNAWMRARVDLHTV